MTPRVLAAEETWEDLVLPLGVMPIVIYIVMVAVLLLIKHVLWPVYGPRWRDE
jgi:hypothetical protein